jgi:hypothetical protein
VEGGHERWSGPPAAGLGEAEALGMTREAVRFQRLLARMPT